MAKHFHQVSKGRLQIGNTSRRLWNIDRHLARNPKDKVTCGAWNRRCDEINAAVGRRNPSEMTAEEIQAKLASGSDDDI